MIIDLSKGRYVLAVSGGVDSMVLLDLLVKQANSSRPRAKSSTSSIELVVAHFNHGIRPDSAEDENLVVKTAQEYNLPLEVGRGNLGPGVSEEAAREARYIFFDAVAKKHGAKGIITAHHQDDLIETAFLNILRGTGRTGLSSMKNSKVYRPLLDVSKKEVLAYAKNNKIRWREDSTNCDTKYLRNYLRVHVMPNLTEEIKTEILTNLDKAARINKVIDKQIATLSHLHQGNRLSRQAYTMLPARVGEEVLAAWLRQNKVMGFDKKNIKRLSGAVKTGQPGSEHDVLGGRKLKLSVRTAELI